MFTIQYPEITAYTLSQDGQYIAVASIDSIKVCLLSSGEDILCLRIESYIYSLSFSSDNNYLAAGGFGHVFVLNILENSRITNISCSSNVRAISFSNDGKYLAISEDNGSTHIHIWQVQELLNNVCQRVTRNLTVEECQQHMIDEKGDKLCQNLP